MSAFDENGVTKPSVPEDVNFLEQLVGEDKKFKSIEDLAKGKAESDRYIEELEVKLRKTETVETKLDQLMSRLAEQNNKSTAQGESQQDTDLQPGTNQHVDNPQLNADSVEALVEKMLAEKQVQTTQESNLEFVEQKLEESFGARKNDVVMSRARELGMPVDQLKEMAKSSPKAFLELLRPSQTQSNSSFQSTHNSDAVSSVRGNQNKPERGWSYYQDLRRKNKAEFFRRFNEIQDAVDRYGSDVFYNS